MIGAIIGDIVGSRYEFNNKNIDIPYDFDFINEDSKFTDDTILTIATAEAIMDNNDFCYYYQKWFDKYKDSGWGGMFKEMALKGEIKPYGSYGNGSAMRVSPCGWISSDYNATIKMAEKSAIVTHDHIEGIKGAVSVAAAIYLARENFDKDRIMKEVSNIGYDLSKKVFEFEKKFDVTCQGTIPLCMALFNESVSFEDSIRKSVIHGGDCDTNACIVGGISEAFYGLPSKNIMDQVFDKLPNEMISVIEKFTKKHCYL
jgi:ADP-ribosyl-[dinitrogen reductase] hydrolase